MIIFFLVVFIINKFQHFLDGDLSAKANVVDAYMKQKHRLIWQRRNPDKDLVGLDKQKEVRKEIAEYQNRMINDPIKG
jgi:hypothetical protein